jgi:hypothetical protein
LYDGRVMQVDRLLAVSHHVRPSRRSRVTVRRRLNEQPWTRRSAPPVSLVHVHHTTAESGAMETADESVHKQDEAARKELDKAAQQALDAIARRYDEATSELARQRSQQNDASSAGAAATPPEQSKGPDDAATTQPTRRGQHAPS